MSITEINEAFAKISPEALTSGRNADGIKDGSNDWDHDSAAAARAVTDELGMIWDFSTWDHAHVLAIKTLEAKTLEAE
jgi:hypothetical protein